MGKLPFERRNPTILTRREEPTNPSLGKKPSDRTYQELLKNGIVIIDKPKGPTSHQVAGWVRDMLGLESAGHSGTLDPIVTGVLPIALENGTKVLQSLLNAGKEYVCHMKIHQEASPAKIKDVLNQFVGDIMQLPPIKSAVKRQLRKRTIYYIEVIEINKQDVLFRVGCQAGTYIRKLCFDIGEKLGCGANMQQLVRTKAASFKPEHAVSLNELKDALEFAKQGDETLIRKVVMPFEQACNHLPKAWIFDTTISTVCHGAAIAVPGISKLDSDIKLDDMVAVFSLKGELVCLAKAMMTGQHMAVAQKGIALTPSRVIMPQGVYPK